MLHVHHADRADALVTALGDLLATPLADPFAQEIVSVPTRGVERWLTQCLATRLGTRPDRADGIVANVAFSSPRQLADEAIASACGLDPETDSWQPQRTVWPLLEVVDGSLDEPWLATLAEHLSDSAGTTPEGAHQRRFSAVHHIAHLFDRYAIQRPQLLTAWTAGDDVDASGAALPDTALWQPELWRRLRDRIDAPDPAERTQTAITRIANDPATIEHLPQRLSVFGLTRLPPGHLDVLRAIATHRDVHLYLLHPSPALWQQIAKTHPPSTTATKRAHDPTATTPRHRLLASWGRDVRELQLVLGAPDSYADEPAIDQDTTTPTTLLHHLQHAIRTDTPPPATQNDRPTLDNNDRSIDVHSCHGHARQVEVLRDAVLHALAADPTLQPRDVIVMCPDIETFAPLIQATFGATAIAAGDPKNPTDGTSASTDLRVRLADRATTQTNPLLGTIARLLELGDQRLSASQVLDLVSRGPIRRRFGLDDDALVRFEDWITTTGIRWGLDPEHRAPYHLDKVTANTWRAGTDRVLLGTTMTEDGLPLVGGVLPLDDVESGAIDLAGRFAELIARLQSTVNSFSTPKPMHEWASAIAHAADLLTATSAKDAWQRAALDRLLADLTQQADTSTTQLDLAETRALLAEHLEGRPTRANFRTGHLTICTLHPMRTVPHRVIGLLGLDDGVFPRKTPRDSDDLLLADPFVGDHDPRTEDRQMLLDALMAAQDKLIVTYTGNDERTNAPKPPAVPVGELLDVVDRTVRTDDETDRPRDRITIRHPLQPFDPRNFTPGELIDDAPWSFDPVTLGGALAIAGDRTPEPPFLTEPLDALTDPVVELEDLVRFVNHPAKAFLRRRLGISLGDHSDEILDALPLELDGLQKWGVGERLLQACLAGNPRARARAAEDARGTLPPGMLADGVVTPVGRNVRALQAAAEHMLARTTDLDSLDVKIALPDGRALTGTVSGLCDDTLQTVGYSRLAPKHRLAAWVRLLALTAARPERRFEAVTIGLLRAFGNRDCDVSVSRIPPLGDDAETRRATALQHLATLVDLLDRGLREPPPLACVTSHAYALALRRGADPTKDADKAWTSTFDWDKEDKDPEHMLLHGGIATLDDLLEEHARPDETGADWPTAGDDKTRFGRWSLRLWSGLLDVEELRDL